MVVVLAQLPDNGVKVYCVVALKFGAGDQKPVMPFKDVF
jgi:hypothetical protein